MADTEDLTFGYWVRRRRKALDLTQEQLADRVGCAAVTIRTIESGMRRPSPPMAERMADCLAVEPSERAAFLRAARVVLAEENLPPPLAAPIVQAVAPPVRAEPPAAPNRLIGRALELIEITALLLQPDLRMVTLTGPGGVGKTRIGAAVALELRSSFRDGVAFVSLVHLSDPTLVVTLIVQALGLPEVGMYTALERLKHALSEREMLLVIDNFEQVIEAAAQLAELLAAAPHLKLLITSQAALRLSSEYEYPLAPLDLPVAQGANLTVLRESSAVQLFVERARATRPQFELNAENASAVATICAQLDGLPLAIELAAARIALLTPQALLERLQRRLPILVGGPRDRPARQQTLRAAIDWSYDLLGSAEQRLLARLAVFAGSFTLAAVEVVNGSDQTPDQLEQSLERIINQSLIRRVDAGQEPRFVMLGIIREYANERLIDRGEDVTIRTRHAIFYRDLAETAAPALFGSEQAFWLTQLQQEWPNLRAALEWCATPGPLQQPDLLARLAVALWWFWYTQGYHAEGRSWLERVLALDSASLAAARAGYCAATLAYRQGAYRQAATFAEQSRVRCLALGDTLGLAYAQGVLALIVLVQGDQARAVQLAQEAQPTLRAAQHTWGIAATQIILGAAARFTGDYATAVACLAESMRLFREIGDRWGTATALGEQAIALASMDGDWSRAPGLLEESLHLFRLLGDRAGIGHALHRLGRAARLCGEHDRVLALLREQLDLFRSLGDLAGRAYAIWEAATLMAADGQHTLAARLFGLAEELTSAIHMGMSSDLQFEYAAARHMTEQALGEIAFQAALAAGRDSDIDQLLAGA